MESRLGLTILKGEDKFVHMGLGVPHSKNSGYEYVEKLGRGKARLGHLSQLQCMVHVLVWCEEAMSHSTDNSASRQLRGFLPWGKVDLAVAGTVGIGVRIKKKYKDTRTLCRMQSDYGQLSTLDFGARIFKLGTTCGRREKTHKATHSTSQACFIFSALYNRNKH